MVLALHGRDYECLDPSETDHIARRFESVTRIFDEHFRLYQYLLKNEDPALPAEHYLNPVVEQASADRLSYLSSKTGKLYSLETYLVVVYEGWRPARALRNRLARWITQPKAALSESLSTEKALHRLEQDLDRACEFLTNKVASFALQLGDLITVDILHSQRAFGFFRRLLNYSPFKTESVRLKYNSFVDYQLCGSSLECHRNFLRLDDYFVQVLTMKEPPVRTFAQMTRGLAEIPSNYVITSEWKRESTLKMRQLIRSKRRHFHNSKASLLNYLNTGKQGGTPDILIDDSAVALIASLGGCLEEIEVRSRAFGEFAHAT